MSSTSRRIPVAFCLPILLALELCVTSLSASSVGNSGGAAAYSAVPTSVHSPALEETNDVASFMLAGTDLTPIVTAGSSAAVSEKSASVVSSAVSGLSIAGSAPEALVPLLSDAREAAWDVDFAAGILESQSVVEAQESNVGSWVLDFANSQAVVPARMLRAEVLLQVAVAAPSVSWKEKTAERGLRLYYHAKWLAERNYVRAAEYRYHEAAQLARSSRRSVLASHALARLGYFLVKWGRQDEARHVLEESMELNTKSNPLAFYLYGVLERKVAAGDVERLRIAEDAILKSGEQPSDELELERGRLVAEITYWREAESSSWQCLAGSDAAYLLICFCGHAATLVQQLLL